MVSAIGSTGSPAGPSAAAVIATVENATGKTIVDSRPCPEFSNVSIGRGLGDAASAGAEAVTRFSGSPVGLRGAPSPVNRAVAGFLTKIIAGWSTSGGSTGSWSGGSLLALPSVSPSESLSSTRGAATRPSSFRVRGLLGRTRISGVGVGSAATASPGCGAGSACAAARSCVPGEFRSTPTSTDAVDRSRRDSNASNGAGAAGAFNRNAVVGSADPSMARSPSGHERPGGRVGEEYARGTVPSSDPV